MGWHHAFQRPMTGDKFFGLCKNEPRIAHDKIFHKCGEIWNTKPTPEKVLNVSIYWLYHFHKIWYAGQQVSRHIESLFCVWNGFIRLVHRTSNYDKIQNTSLIPYNVMNISIHGSPFYVIIYRSLKLLKMVQFLCPILYIQSCKYRCQSSISVTRKC